MRKPLPKEMRWNATRRGAVVMSGLSEVRFRRELDLILMLITDMFIG